MPKKLSPEFRALIGQQVLYLGEVWIVRGLHYKHNKGRPWLRLERPVVGGVVKVLVKQEEMELVRD
jgi:hypothetical protein